MSKEVNDELEIPEPYMQMQRDLSKAHVQRRMKLEADRKSGLYPPEDVAKQIALLRMQAPKDTFDLLPDGARRRLAEITIQEYPIEALSTTAAIGELELRPDQIRKMRNILSGLKAEFKDAQRRWRSQSKFKYDWLEAERLKSYAGAERQSRAVLIEPQRKRLDEIRGRILPLTNPLKSEFLPTG